MANKYFRHRAGSFSSTSFQYTQSRLRANMSFNWKLHLNYNTVIPNTHKMPYRKLSKSSWLKYRVQFSRIFKSEPFYINLIKCNFRISNGNFSVHFSSLINICLISMTNIQLQNVMFSSLKRARAYTNTHTHTHNSTTYPRCILVSHGRGTHQYVPLYCAGPIVLSLFFILQVNGK
jgi:hypothetical protein